MLDYIEKNRIETQINIIRLMLQIGFEHVIIVNQYFFNFEKNNMLYV
jgi:hypothetical protein